MFTTPCFIRKNTKEIANTIALIGYDLLFSAINNYGEYLVCNGNSCQGQNDTTLKESTIDYIDCGINEELFLAIAALRDDSNEHQWFIWDNDEDEGDKWKLYDGNSNWSWWIFEVHKATIKELIEHFK